jgi:lysozyme
MYDKDILIQELMRDEGVQLKPYRDTVGKLTIGVGRNLNDVGISRPEALGLLANDIAAAECALDKVFPKWKSLTDTRQRVLLNMVFNMGPSGLTAFSKFIANLSLGDWGGAATEMLNSKWAVQVGQRAVRLADMMRRG